MCEVNDTRSGINQRSAARYFHSLIIQHVGLTVVKEFVESEWGLTFMLAIWVSWSLGGCLIFLFLHFFVVFCFVLWCFVLFFWVAPGIPGTGGHLTWSLGLILGMQRCRIRFQIFPSRAFLFSRVFEADFTGP